MTEGKWTRGDIQIGVVHRGQTYIFHSREKQQMFLASPDTYSPMLSGFDPVVYHETGQLVPGQRRYGAIAQSRVGATSERRMFLFDSPESLAKFKASPDSYTNTVLQAMQNTSVRRR